MICEKCGKALQIGEFPFCGGRNAHGFPLQGIAVIDDTIEGGPRFFDTMGHEDVWIESKSQWRREVAARNLEHVDRHDSAYHARVRRMREEHRRDTRKEREA